MVNGEGKESEDWDSKAGSRGERRKWDLREESEKEGEEWVVFSLFNI